MFEMKPVVDTQDPIRQACVASCEDTYRLALEGASFLLHEGADPHVIHSMMDAADICRAHTGFLLRGSDPKGLVARACAAVCLRAAEACEGLTDRRIRAFRESASACADHCLEVAERGPAS